MIQLELGLNDRQLVRSLTTGNSGRLDEIRGNIAFVYFESEGVIMCATERVVPVEHLFFWPLYYGNPDGFNTSPKRVMEGN